MSDYEVDFEYEEDDENNQDVDLENMYYTAKGSFFLIQLVLKKTLKKQRICFCKLTTIAIGVLKHSSNLLNAAI